MKDYRGKGEKLPEVFCRKDFPIVPHLNVLEDGQKTLCLSNYIILSTDTVSYLSAKWRQVWQTSM